MNGVNTAEEIIAFIKNSTKKTPVKAYINGELNNLETSAKVFKGDGSYIIIGESTEIEKILENNKKTIKDVYIENDRRNSGVPMLDIRNINARIEPGAIIRDKVTIGDNAVIMMGAVINIGAIIGDGTMIDMGAVLGGRATVGKNCHIGAGAVLAGVVEPPSATPVIVEDGVLIGANAVVIEGVRIGKGAVVGAGAVVIEDVPAGAVVTGNPARVIKTVDEKTLEKTQLVDDLRK
ncbi:2,3,4,5-tetrahydropyridine-2,6-dicarboxylate N-acetyltransferase [Fusobacterium perfoetens]|uniref:2,3,4,5-tetrahydropyridine-2,6-dicarboxylate N-acetyltransferase n=1 Tax=Fusobacterium perfoetens TaxID=852 RepID=UPI000485A818|nr:2,3,4,5-tetrahydropyridine-2,6-dicarboxylate N-acetyltransferase [Fusobacterium perfoetens]MCI6152804.1 2,3,4,5-tetrahydropyridine-2,6-dicarboxylate N-acetyltransferase [Fusobacterium perfoetens]MDY3236698.1 2,3,4,5-tetrahydropyridine-2,6-dicarboxylate N-acetyltransferase [Fusobacterium perfoetens]